ncbi:MAG TPA: lytic transglycosylase domain-containing protein, partial [Blastocatellia bacterium]|nr:lytic transglycosylase domain-containing protein [Blastocatellia bacterium]
MAIAACAAMGFFASDALAQTPPPTPHESTQLAVPSSGSGMLVDFNKPDEPPAADTATEKPADTLTVDRSMPTQCSTGDATVDAFVREAGARYGVDPCLVTAVMRAESGFRRYAVSPKGASGYMQLMPETARRFGVVDLFDARQNIHAGTRYLRFLLDRFGGSVELALAGYNAGESAVDRYGRRIPPFLETQNYVRTIAGRYYSQNAGMSAIRPAATQAAAPDPAAAIAYRPPSGGWLISVNFDEEATHSSDAPVAPVQP